VEEVEEVHHGCGWEVKVGGEELARPLCDRYHRRFLIEGGLMLFVMIVIMIVVE
jgi:hypothetical protein